jgi:hypothetical protein
VGRRKAMHSRDDNNHPAGGLELEQCIGSSPWTVGVGRQHEQILSSNGSHGGDIAWTMSLIAIGAVELIGFALHLARRARVGRRTKFLRAC